MREPRDPLSPQDGAAGDAVLDRDSSATVEPQRKARVEAWLKVLASATSPAAPGDLAARTLAAVEAAPLKFPSQEGARQAEASYAPAGGWRRRMAEIGAMAVAAMLLLLVTVQGLGQMQRSKARIACKTNLDKLALAFNAYAQYCDGELPALAMPANGNWLHGNSPTAAKNNSANLIPLVNHNYAPMYAFYCPGAMEKAPPPSSAPLTNELPPISYSYRNMYRGQQVMWDGRHDSIIITDKNPLFTASARTTSGGEMANSPNHGGNGSYVMRGDGSVTWETSPNIGPLVGSENDNIWTLGSGKDRQLTYSGVEYPKSASDVFVGP